MVFAKFIKKLQIPSEYYQAVENTFSDKLGEVEIILRSISSDFLKPGDLITFSYESIWRARRLLVVGTKHAPRAKYISGKGNYLLCCYELDESLPGMSMVFSSFYKNRSVNYSKMPKTLNTVFGVTNFKTFNIDKIESLFEVALKDKK